MATEHKNLSEFDPTQLPDASQMRFGLVVSEWNSEITENLFEGARDTLLACGVPPAHITRWNVPGSFELPFGCRKLIKHIPQHAVIAIGSVIRGETRHFDFVCEAVAQGVKDLNVQGNTPVIFCVLTDDTLEQARARSGGRLGNKGTEAAVAAIKMASLGH